MITFFEYKNNFGKSFAKDILNSIKENGIAVIQLTTDDNKIQIKQFEQIKKQIKYKPDHNIKFYWNNSNNFVIVDSDKIKFFQI